MGTQIRTRVYSEAERTRLAAAALLATLMASEPSREILFPRQPRSPQ